MELSDVGIADLQAAFPRWSLRDQGFYYLVDIQSPKTWGTSSVVMSQSEIPSKIFQLITLPLGENQTKYMVPRKSTQLDKMAHAEKQVRDLAFYKNGCSLKECP